MTREEAIEVIKRSCTEGSQLAAACAMFIPELAESEDEKIRKEIIEFANTLKSGVESGRVSMGIRKDDIAMCNRWIAYLEKQKEQKPAECIEDSVKFEEGFKAGRESGLRDGQKYVLNNLDSYGLCKPTEWSEEDGKILRVISYKISQHQGNDERSLFTPDEAEFITEMEDKLKSLRPHWKPSEEQQGVEPLTKLEKAIYDMLVERTNEETISEKQARKCAPMFLAIVKDEILGEHWKPSEQEKGALRTAIYILTNERNFPRAAAHLQNILDAFEGKESRKDWKPSPLQLKALELAANDNLLSCEELDMLNKLYEQLKKL